VLKATACASPRTAADSMNDGAASVGTRKRCAFAPPAATQAMLPRTWILSADTRPVPSGSASGNAAMKAGAVGSVTSKMRAPADPSARKARTPLTVIWRAAAGRSALPTIARSPERASRTHSFGAVASADETRSQGPILATALAPPGIDRERIASG